MAFEAPRSKRKEPLEWGLYQILWSRTYQEQLQKELGNFASKADYVMFYRDLGRQFPKFAVDSIDAVGATAVVSLELWTWHGGRRGSYIPKINAGEYDEFFRKWAIAAREDGRRVLLRFGFEFNGDWFTWSGDAPAFVRAWRRIHKIFKQVGATSVEWVWSPNVVSCPDVKGNGIHEYYPGDEYVDWVAVDGYNFGDHHDKWHKWQTFDDVFHDLLTDFSTRYRGKKMMLGEFGCAVGGAKQRVKWIRDAYRSLERFPQVRAVVWFNYDKRRENEPNFRIDATEGALRAFNETFAAPKTIKD